MPAPALEAPAGPRRSAPRSAFGSRRRRRRKSRARRRRKAPIDPPSPAAGPRRCFQEEAGWILDTAYRIGRKSGMTPIDAEDFVGWASLRIIRRDFAVLRACRDPQRLRGYLGMVLRNLAKDYRNHLWGKWRPTVAARNFGRYGIELERLCVRDGFSTDEAVEVLRRNRAHSPDTAALEDMVGRMPMRPRQTQVPFDTESLGQQVAIEQDPTAFEAREFRVQVRSGLAAAMAELEEEDRELLAQIFEDNRSVASIAREFDLDQRALYHRRDRCLQRLRRALQQQGVVWSDVVHALADGPGANLPASVAL